MKDYYATLRIQHGRMKAAMQQVGIATLTELAKRANVSQNSVVRLFNFKVSPLRQDGTWRLTTRAICRVLGAEPLDLFPHHLHHELLTNRMSAYVERAQLCGENAKQLNPYEACEQAELERTLDEVVHTLSPRERWVLKARFWDEATLEEAAETLGFSHEYVRQIEGNALRKLRHPERLGKLAGATALGDGRRREMCTKVAPDEMS